MRRDVSYFFTYFGMNFWVGATTHQESMISRTLHPTSLYIKIKRVLFHSCMCQRPEREAFTLKGVGHGFMAWKRRGESFFLGCAQNLFSRILYLWIWEEIKNKRKIIFLSIFLLPLYLLQKSIFNLWKDFKDLKKRSRSVKKKVFMWASIF